jgi:type II secretory pathway component PulF
MHVEFTIMLAASTGSWVVGVQVWLVVVLVVLGVSFALGKHVLGLPLRRQENSRLFLDVLELALERGQQLEEAFLSLARTGDRSLDLMATPRTPLVLGIIHILLGLIGLSISIFKIVITVNEMSSSFIVDPFALSTALLLLIALVALLVPALYIVAGVQLIRSRASGRWLAMGLAIVQFLLIAGSSALLFFGGNAVEAVMALLGLILPAVFLICLTHPQVVAVCGREGRQLPALETRLREGMGLVEALRISPGLIEPRLMALLEVGRELGDLKKILPACRAVLTGATGKIRKAHSYLMLLALVITPMTLIILPIMDIFFFPKFEQIMTDMEVPGGTPTLFVWLTENLWWLASLHGLVMLALWVAALHYLGGPRLRLWLAGKAPGLMGRLQLVFPWKRKRLQRDFSALLAILLDAGLAEARSVQLAADSTGNRIFQQRAELTCTDLENGVPLPEAIRRMDDAGEFRWRLTTAARAGQGFLPALRAWHEGLEARAFQQEQAVAQLATTSLVFYNGAMVGLVMACVFQFLMNVMETVSLW